VRRVTQTKVGWPDGNCVRASYASLLGVDLDLVPDFSPAALRGDNQRAAERAWLRDLGYDLVVVPEGGARPDVSPDTLHLVSGLSPRGFGHCCVGRGGQVVWDPHPSRAGLVEVWHRAFLVPHLDPAVAGSDHLLGFSGWL
jgi:hypothetical protein